MSSTETQPAAPQADISTTNADVNGAVSEASAASSEQASEQIAQGATAAPTPQAPTYTPNFKYRAALEDKEVEDFWRPLIKDKESEERVIKALKKLDGFDQVYESKGKILSEYQTLQKDYESVQDEVTRFNEALSKGDLTSAFRQIGLTDQQIFQWTQQRLQFMEMPPEQRKAIEDRERLQMQQQMIEQEKSQYQKMYEEQAVQTRTLHLDFVLSRPEVAQSADSWDKVMGQGAFKNLVISEAKSHFFATNEDLTPDQAVQMVLGKFGKLMSQQRAGMTGAPQMHQPGELANPQTKPVIPNVSGKNASPIKRQAKSIDDIKRITKELEAAENN